MKRLQKTFFLLRPTQIMVMPDSGRSACASCQTSNKTRWLLKRRARRKFLENVLIGSVTRCTVPGLQRAPRCARPLTGVNHLCRRALGTGKPCETSSQQPAHKHLDSRMQAQQMALRNAQKQVRISFWLLEPPRMIDIWLNPDTMPTQCLQSHGAGLPPCWPRWPLTNGGPRW